jgi:hypothetical protein
VVLKDMAVSTEPFHALSQMDEWAVADNCRLALSAGYSSSFKSLLCYAFSM